MTVMTVMPDGWDSQRALGTMTDNGDHDRDDDDDDDGR